MSNSNRNIRSHEYCSPIEMQFTLILSQLAHSLPIPYGPTIGYYLQIMNQKDKAEKCNERIGFQWVNNALLNHYYRGTLDLFATFSRLFTD